jgi:hypothetical protein
VVSTALFNPSDFLIAGNTAASYTAEAVPAAPYVVAASSNKPEFSEYLAALDEPAEGETSPSAAAESAAADEEDRESGSLLVTPQAAVRTGNAGENVEKALAGGDGETEYGTEIIGDTETSAGKTANDKIAGGVFDEGVNAALGLNDGPAQKDSAENEEAESASQVESFAEITPAENEGAAKNSLDRRRALSGETGGAEGEEVPVHENAPEGPDGGAPLNVDDGFFVEEFEKEEPPQARLAAAGENSGGMAAAVSGAAEDAALTETAAPPPPSGGGGASSGSEKKPSAERSRRNTASGRIERSETAGGVSAAGAAETPSASEAPGRINGGAETEITVNLRGGHRGGAASDGQGGGAKPEASFETFLARELNQNLNGGIVRQAQVMLREGGEGTIRLALKPESLGKVKIRLEMAENKVTGRIIVESGEALRAFEHEIGSLEQTFRSEGFDSAALSLELAEHDGARGGEGGWRRNGGKISTKTASSRYDEAVDRGGYLAEAYSAKQINVLV